MKRRDVLLAIPAAAIGRAQTPQKKTTPGKKTRAIDPKLDQQVLAIMLLLLKRKDPSTVATYSIIDTLKAKNQADASSAYPIFGKFSPKVYQQAQAHLNSVASAIQNYQQAIQSVSLDVQSGDPYPNNECPLWASIDMAVNALLS